RIIQAVCESVGWEVGAIWSVDPEAGLLQCVDVWHVPGLDAAPFEAACRGQAFPAGVGLPGRVWASGKPAWIVDVARDENFPPAPVAEQLGLHGAFGFPIVFGGAVTGVIEFFSRDTREPDDDLLRMFTVIGSQAGQFIARKDAEARLRDSE